MALKETDDPKCSEGGLVIRVKAVGICGSDVRTYESGSGKIKPPMILGHEVAGEVVEVGKAHTSYHVGDRIAMAPGIFCNRCYYCQHGMRTMCENLEELAFQYQGGFAEYMPIPGAAFERGRIVPIPEGLSFEHASICEPPSSCIMAQERAGIGLGDTVVILGAGPIGCIHTQIARARGASKIILVEVSAERLQMARAFHADFYVDSNQVNPVDKVKEITKGLGADCIIVAAPSAVAQVQAIEMSRKRGTVVLFGGLPKDRPFASLNCNLIHYRDIRVIGHYGQERHHVSLALEMISRGIVSADKLISDVLPLDQYSKGFELMRDKKALKVILIPEVK
jgi:L-iditol 2-dehydrogenase